MTISIVTPTFDRLPLLTRCFESLLQQTCHEFEWVVVDDGSTDDTAAAVARWAEHAPFPIRLMRQANQGKHVALNRAFASDLRPHALLLDSDDVLAPGAIDSLRASLALTQPHLAGVIGNCFDRRNYEVVGRAMPIGVAHSTGRELRERFGVEGDTVRAYRTDLLRAHRFPEFPGEKFVPENLLFDPIDRDHRLVVVRDVIVLCEYQDAGLSASIMEHRAASPHGFAASLESSAWISRRLPIAVKYTLKYQIWSKLFFGRYGLKGFRRRALFGACLPLAVVLRACRQPRFIFETRAKAPLVAAHVRREN